MAKVRIEGNEPLGRLCSKQPHGHSGPAPHERSESHALRPPRLP